MTIADPKKLKSLVLIISLLLVVLFSLLMILILKGCDKPKPVVNNTNNNNQQNNNDSRELKPIISGWKVYENKEYGFRIDYPGEWKARENEKNFNSNMNVVNLISPDLLNPNDPQILESDKEEVYERIRNFDLPSMDNYLTYNSDISIRRYSSLVDMHGANSIKELIENNNEISDVGKIKISDIEAIDFIWRGEGEEYVIIFKNNGYFYEIALNRTSSKESISGTLQQILSTFRLIKQYDERS